MVRIGIVGLGRLGKRHACNLANKVEGAQLVAACSIVEQELQWAQKELSIQEVYTDFDQMLTHADIDAVFLVSSSSAHAEQIIASLDAGLHVFCEKPMGISLRECLLVEDAVEKHPDRTFFVGFVRRFDASYAYAKQKIEEGLIGEPFIVRSQTVDLDEYAEFQLEFVKKSGGIFMDCNVHDIDLARWFLGDEIASVYAVGASYVHPGFADLGDADNTVAVCNFMNKKIAILSASRTAFHGHDTHTTITGSKGILKIGLTPSKNRVEIFDSYGARKECVNDFFERFQDAFLQETQAFIDCIRNKNASPILAKDGTQATLVAHALTKSFKSGEIVQVANLAKELQQ